MNEHDKWLARQAYHEVFSDNPKFFLSWRGLPNRCKCGCGGVWYDRVSPVNWWRYWSPELLWRVGFLFPIFRALHGVCWTIPPLIWSWFQICSANYKDLVFERHRAEQYASALFGARLLVYGIIAPLVVGLCTVSWIVSRLGGALIMGIHFVSLGLVAAFVLVLFVLAVSSMAVRGIVFIIGGVASVVYLDYPIFGTVLVIVGVLVEYERIRRNEKKHEEQLGTLLLHRNGINHDEPVNDLVQTKLASHLNVNRP